MKPLINIAALVCIALALPALVYLMAGPPVFLASEGALQYAHKCGAASRELLAEVAELRADNAKLEDYERIRIDERAHELNMQTERLLAQTIADQMLYGFGLMKQEADHDLEKWKARPVNDRLERLQR